VDVDVNSQRARVHAWMHMFSPRSETYNLAARAGAAVGAGWERRDCLLTWQGLPGDGFGAMNSGAARSLSGDTYEISLQTTPAETDRSSMSELPVVVWSSRSLSGHWHGELPEVEAGDLTVTKAGLLQGEITNVLATGLSDGRLYYDRWAYTLGDLAPGERIRIQDQRAPRNIEWMLTRRKVIDTKDISTPWDATSLDVPRIMEMIMFHDAAGGRQYTRLLHRHQRHIDLSSHLNSGRAILVGRAEQPATELLRDGEALLDRHDVDHRFWTFYRLIFPVQPAK
jgi:hypothetical protein